MTPVSYCENLYAEQVTIPNGASVAPGILTEGRALVGVLMPAAWTAANLGFEASFDGATFGTVYTASGTLSQTVVTADDFIAFPAADAIFAPYLKVKSVDNANVAVNQTADRTLTLLFKALFGGR